MHKHFYLQQMGMTVWLTRPQRLQTESTFQVIKENIGKLPLLVMIEAKHLVKKEPWDGGSAYRLLRNILQSFQVSLDMVSIVVYATPGEHDNLMQQTFYQDYIEKIQPKRILIFSQSASYEQRLNENEIICNETVESLLSSPALKKKLFSLLSKYQHQLQFIADE